MKYIDKPAGASIADIEKLSLRFQVKLPKDFIEWWLVSDGPIAYWGFKELQFFSIVEILGEDIYELNESMPGSMPICMDGNGNICVAKIESQEILGIYVASCGDLGWEESQLVSSTFSGFVTDKLSPEERLNA